MTEVTACDVVDARGLGSLAQYCAARVDAGLNSGSFLVTNLTSVLTQWAQWQQELPMVEPFYAVKCNPDPRVLRLLSSLGCKFDCATMGEIDLVLHGTEHDMYAFV